MVYIPRTDTHNGTIDPSILAEMTREVGNDHSLEISQRELDKRAYEELELKWRLTVRYPCARHAKTTPTTAGPHYIDCQLSLVRLASLGQPSSGSPDKRLTS
jgi:hypothetical protein